MRLVSKESSKHVRTEQESWQYTRIFDALNQDRKKNLFTKNQNCSPIRTDCCILASFAWSMMDGKYLFQYRKRRGADFREEIGAAERGKLL